MNYLNKVVCGDCVKIMKHFPDGVIDFILTDPPYSLRYNFANDDLSYEQQKDFMNIYCKEFFRVLKSGGVVATFLSQEMSHYWFFISKNCGFTWQNEIIWNRDGGQMPTKKLGICHEVINIFSKGEPKTFNLDELRIQSKYADTDKRLNPKGKNPGDVWYIPAMFGKKLERILGKDGKAAHPTQKPIDTMIPLVLLYSNPKDLILDPFCGTGTSLEAAFKLDRKFIGIDISEEYCELARQRALA